MLNKDALKNLSVLFVEDEASLLQLLVSALSPYFHSYNTAINGEEGLKKFQECLPDIIISDITMPLMDGLTMAEKIHEIKEDIPIIILSAYSERDKLLHAIEAKITKYFIKPFDPDELLTYLYKLGEKIESGHKIKLSNAFVFDTKTNKLLKYNQLVRLTNRELTLIMFLIKSTNHTISYEEIKLLIGKGGIATDENVRVFIRRFREKTDKSLIQNLPKQGYSLAM